MKKQILFVFTAILSFALFSCESNPEKVEIKKNSTDVNDHLSHQSGKVRKESNRSFEQLKRDSEDANRKAKERIKFQETDNANKTFEQMKREAEEANRKAKKKLR